MFSLRRLSGCFKNNRNGSNNKLLIDCSWDKQRGPRLIEWKVTQTAATTGSYNRGPCSNNKQSNNNDLSNDNLNKNDLSNNLNLIYTYSNPIKMLMIIFRCVSSASLFHCVWHWAAWSENFWGKSKSSSEKIVCLITQVFPHTARRRSRSGEHTISRSDWSSFVCCD